MKTFVNINSKSAFVSFGALTVSVLSFVSAVFIMFSAFETSTVLANSRNTSTIAEPQWVEDFDKFIDNTDTTSINFDVFGDTKNAIKRTVGAVSKNKTVQNVIKAVSKHKVKKTKISMVIHNNTTSDVVATQAVLPQKIYIATLNKKLNVTNAKTTKISEMNKELLKGVVRYPGTGFLNEQSRSVVIFGHSSHLAQHLVHNQMYRAFNGIEKLKYDSRIVITGTDGKDYVYRVRSVKKMKAGESSIYVNTPKRTLTLVTCDNFGAKEDRWVVKADFITVF